MFSNVGRAAIFAALLGSSVTNAFWILSHSSLTQDRLDPVVSAGKVSSHVHTVVGAQNFKPVLTTSDMQASSCTTSPVQADMRSVGSSTPNTLSLLSSIIMSTATIGHPSYITITWKTTRIR